MTNQQPVVLDLSLYVQNHLKIQGWHPSDVRALDFFSQVAGPALSGDFDDYFWTHLVGQLCHQEDAVRHAMVSISLLYEQQNQHSVQGEQQPHVKSALQHYNAAIRSLSTVREETVVLLTCILFVCVEFLLGNSQLAIDHCRHGTLVHNATHSSTALSRHHLAPMYRRMSIFPFFFGSTVSTFPALIEPVSPVPEKFSALSQAQAALDEILSMSIRFVRKADAYRWGESKNSLVPETLLNEQKDIKELLELWDRAFCDFRPKNSQENLRTRGSLQIRYLVVVIWTDAALDRQEIAFDRHLNRFQSILETATQLKTTACLPNCPGAPPTFTFEMGLLPLLYFAVIKCRDLRTRLGALSSMKDLAASREGLWDANTMSAVGRRVIEIEHCIDLNDNKRHFSLSQNTTLPAEVSRIWDSQLGPVRCCLDENGHQVSQRKATYILRSAGDEFLFLQEWVNISQ